MPAAVSTRPRRSLPKVELPRLRTGSSSGVRTLWAPQEGMFVGTLRFRVGFADETLTTHGITHVVEHLALSGVDRKSVQYNGWVKLNTTTFVAAGERSEVQAFLANVAEALSELPVHRLEEQLRILRSEAAQSKAGPMAGLLTRRFGARSYGLPWYHEFGFDTVTPERVLDHAKRYFTADNAVLTLTGSSRGFRVDLPDGEAMQLPEATTVRSVPGYVEGADDLVAASWMTDRGLGTGMYTTLMEQRMLERLRHDESLVYSVSSNMERIGGRVMGALMTPVTAENRRATAKSFASVLEDSKFELFTQADVDEQNDAAIKSLPGAAKEVLGWLDRATDSLLFNGDFDQPADSLRQALAIDADAVNEAGKQAAASMLLTLPSDARVQGYGHVPIDRGTAPTEATARSRSYFFFGDAWDTRETLDVGSQALTLRTPATGLASSHRWEDVAGVMHFDDGTRVVINGDGRFLTIDPARWFGFARLVERIDAKTPPELILKGEGKGSRGNGKSPERRFAGVVALTALACAALIAGIVFVVVANRGEGLSFLIAPVMVVFIRAMKDSNKQPKKK